jgi:phage FluMu protein Com
MAIFRCNKCGHIREVGFDYIGKSVKCPECEQITTIYDTVTFIKAVIKKYQTQTKELENLKQESSNNDLENQSAENISFEEIDLHNTNVLAQANNLEPIFQWFKKRNVQVQFKPDAADTTGFFDEIAIRLGNDFDVLSHVSNQIKYGQNKGFSSIKIEISKKTPQDIQKVTSFCKELYDYSFVAKYFYQKKEKVIRLTLQTAPRIREFFNGLWMEWFTLMKLLHFFRKKKIAPACTRAMEISFDGNNSNELDLFILTENNVPLCIECKSGEFRQDIDKYLSLRKRLDINKNQFVICVFGLSDEQAKGMTSMYDLTFVNETSMIDHIEAVL